MLWDIPSHILVLRASVERLKLGMAQCACSIYIGLLCTYVDLDMTQPQLLSRLIRVVLHRIGIFVTVKTCKFSDKAHSRTAVAPILLLIHSQTSRPLATNRSYHVQLIIGSRITDTCGPRSSPPHYVTKDQEKAKCLLKAFELDLHNMVNCCSYMNFPLAKSNTSHTASQEKPFPE